MVNEINYPSKDGLTQIHAVMWVPTTKVNAILQIEHGMIEYIKRYENIVDIFNEAGILVCGEDHLGNGESVIDKDHYGYIATKRGDKLLVDDAITLTNRVKEKYPNVPYYILGNSLGSFIARNSVALNDNINGLIIMGSAYKSPFAMNLAIIETAIIQFYHHGWFYKSKFLKNKTVGKLYKYFEEKNDDAWRTKDEQVLLKVKNDPLLNFDYTCNGYLNMFRLVKNANKKRTYKKVNKDLPILIISGKDDPIGDFGKSVSKVNDFYKKCKFTNVKFKLYNGLRHELLNEVEKIIVINDIVNFINVNNLKSR
jgi:alpha-beta hydrolase superfamily lysophospholipase